MTSELVGTLEIAQLLSVSRQRADQLTKTDPQFPRPAAELASGRVWDAESVRTWARFRDRILNDRPIVPAIESDVVRRVVVQGRALLASPARIAAQEAFKDALDGLEALIQT